MSGNRQGEEDGSAPVGQGWLGIGNLVDRMPDAVIQIGVNGIVEAASQAVDAIFGWAPDDLIGQPVSVLMGSPERQAHQSYVERYLETGTSGILRGAPRTLSGRHKSGRKVEFELTIGETWVAGERKFIGVCRDASERVAIESQRKEALDELETKVRELELARAELLAAQQMEQFRATEAVELGQRAESAMDDAIATQRVLDLASKLADLHVWELDYRTGSIRRWGAEDTIFEQSLNVRQLIRNPFLAVHPDDREAVVASWKRYIATGKPETVEYRINRLDNQERWVSSTTELLKDSSGQPQRLVSALQNITARKQSEKALNEALKDTEEALGVLKAERASNTKKEAFYQTIVEIMPAFLIVKDARDGSFMLINPAAKTALGIDPGTCIGKTVADIFPAEEAEASAAEDRYVIESREVAIDLAAPITIANGEQKYYTTKKLAVFDEHGPAYIVTAGQDVTGQVAAQNSLKIALNVAESANAAKSQFLANMSHELRTPLNGIIAMADMLLGAQTDDRSRQMAVTIVESGRMLEHVINDILDVAKIEAGQMTLESEPFDLEAVLTRMSNLHSAAAAAKGIRLECSIDPAASGVYLGDETRIGQILSNLLSNAVKFTERGMVQLSVRQSKGGLRLRVSDSGIGFDRATAKRLFDRFEQADVSVSRRHGGTGLGLAICRSFTEMIGGRISVRSVPGRGSLFSVTLPLARVQACEGDHNEPKPLARLDQAEPSDARILFADDHEVNQRVVAMILEPLGVDLTIVENGQAAVDAASASVFDLILMDVQMPVMDGLTATRQIREMEREYGLARTPIISLTANAMPDDVKRSLDAGSDLHMPKPIRPVDLLNAIAALTTRTNEDAGMTAAA